MKAAVAERELKSVRRVPVPVPVPVPARALAPSSPAFSFAPAFSVAPLPPAPTQPQPAIRRVQVPVRAAGSSRMPEPWSLRRRSRPGSEQWVDVVTRQIFPAPPLTPPGSPPMAPRVVYERPEDITAGNVIKRVSASRGSNGEKAGEEGRWRTPYCEMAFVRDRVNGRRENPLKSPSPEGGSEKKERKEKTGW